MLHSTLTTILGTGIITSSLAAFSGLVPYHDYRTLLIIAYVTVELVWLAYFLHIAKLLSDYKPNPPNLTEKVKFVTRMVSYATDNKFWHRWFHGSRVGDEIHKENLIELISCNIYNKLPIHLTKEELDEIDVILEIGKERNSSFTYNEGKLDHIRALKHTMEPIDAVFHPWILYAISGLWQAFAGLLHRLMGFERKQVRINRYIVTYWIHKGSQYLDKPIVVCHGVGVGLLPYINFIFKLYQKKHPIICVEFSHIALNPINKVISNDEVAEAIRMILDTHHYERATFAGHSFGTFIMARFCYKFPERIEAALFIDPVCFQLFMPDVVCKFLYDPPATVFDYFRTYFISKNLHMNYVLRRHFWWYQLNLWRENMPLKTFVVLSENDEIVPVKKVYEYLTEDIDKPEERCMIIPKHGHARWLSSDSLCREFSDIVVDLARKPFTNKIQPELAPCC